jgi:hypothetical protein
MATGVSDGHLAGANSARQGPRGLTAVAITSCHGGDPDPRVFGIHNRRQNHFAGSLQSPIGGAWLILNRFVRSWFSSGIQECEF